MHYVSIHKRDIRWLKISKIYNEVWQISRRSLLWIIGFGSNSLPWQAQHLIWLIGADRIWNVSPVNKILFDNVFVSHIRVHEPSYVARAIKPMLLLDRWTLSFFFFFRYKDRSPSYWLCALFVPSSNHRGLDWKSVDTDADVVRPQSYA